MSLPRGRAHLVERAVEALGGTDGRLPHPVMPQPPAGAPIPAMPPGAAVRPQPATPQPATPGAPAAAEPTPQPVIPLEALVAAGMVAAPRGATRNRVTEEMNLVQQQILRALEEASHGRNRIVVISSARPGEGKSFVSLNISAHMATGGTRNVVLVDADGRKGAITDVLGAGKSPGLCGLAMSPQERRAPLLRTAVDRLLFLPFGQLQPGAVARPSGAALADAVTRLARAMPDHVMLIDTPPSLSTSDANALSTIAGVVVVVVDAERTQRNEVEAALDMMEACPSLQLLLNRTMLTANDSFGAYGEYGADHAG